MADPRTADALREVLAQDARRGAAQAGAQHGGAMTDYTELDDAILRFLENRDGHPTNSYKLERLAYSFTKGEPWRLIDRRMQALSKAGRIKFDRTATNRPHGWVVLPTSTTTTETP